MIKKITLYLSALLLLSCSIEEIPRQPLLATPLGLAVKTTTASGAPGRTALGLFFTTNNPEIYFTGYSIYVSTRLEDFGTFADSAFFPLKPTDVPGSEAQLLTRYADPTDENLTIFVGGAMSFPDRRFYPPTPEELSITGGAAAVESDPTFTSSSFSELPGNPHSDPIIPPTPFVSGTTYYFAAYAYSAVDAAYSLPSNIATIVFP